MTHGNNRRATKVDGGPNLDDLKGDGRAFCKEVAALVQPRPEE
jgi:hypothetical protein